MTLFDLILKNKAAQIETLKVLCLSIYQEMESNMNLQIKKINDSYKNVKNEEEKEWLAENYEEDINSCQYPLYKMLGSFFILIISTFEKQLSKLNDEEKKKIYKKIGIIKYHELANSIKHGYGRGFDCLVENYEKDFIKKTDDMPYLYCSSKFDKLYSNKDEPILNYNIEQFKVLVNIINKYYDNLILKEVKEEFEVI